MLVLDVDASSNQDRFEIIYGAVIISGNKRRPFLTEWPSWHQLFRRNILEAKNETLLNNIFLDVSTM